jgi:hypothetical protein
VVWELFHNPPTSLSPVRVIHDRGPVKSLPQCPQNRTRVQAISFDALCQEETFEITCNDQFLAC